MNPQQQSSLSLSLGIFRPIAWTRTGECAAFGTPHSSVQKWSGAVGLQLPRRKRESVSRGGTSGLIE